jgi:tripartite-type tricarboxylate transporter receptor subunit TctC
LFKHLAGIDMVCVQYKGGGAAVIAVVGGESKLVFSSIATVLQHAQAGRLKAYAIAAAMRFAGAPDIPPAHEAGLPGLEAEQWIGMLAPARTPVALIERLNRDINDVLRTSMIRTTLLAQGAEPAPGTPQEFAAFMRNETMKLGKLIDQIGLRAE